MFEQQEENTWNILNDHFKKKGFARHQLSSFDNFINIGIPKIVTEEPDIYNTEDR